MPNTDNTKKFISLRRLDDFKTLLDEEIDSKLDIQSARLDDLYEMIGDIDSTLEAVL